MGDYSVRNYRAIWFIVEDRDGDPVCDKSGQLIRFDRFDRAAALAAALRQAEAK